MRRVKHILNTLGKPVFSGLLVAVVLLLNAMAASPTLHELIHHDADQPGHECAVTMFAHGKVDTSTVDVSVVTTTTSIEIVPPVIFSVFAPAIENLPPGRAPPVFFAVS